MLQLHQRFMQTAKRFSSRIAVYDKATNQDYTYGRMLIASLILKGYIGEIKGKYIGILLPTSMGAMLAVLGTLMNGKIPVDRKSTRLNSSHLKLSRMPSSA